MDKKAEMVKLVKFLQEKFKLPIIGNGAVDLYKQLDFLYGIAIEEVFYSNGKLKKKLDQFIINAIKNIKNPYIIEYPNSYDRKKLESLQSKYDIKLFAAKPALNSSGVSINNDFRVIFNNLKNKDCNVKEMIIDPDDNPKLAKDKTKVFLYISVGEVEDYRPHFSKCKSLIIKENPNWKGNFRIKYWEPKWREILVDYIESVIKKYPFVDGLFFDVIDGWVEI